MWSESHQVGDGGRIRSAAVTDRVAGLATARRRAYTF